MGEPIKAVFEEMDRILSRRIRDLDENGRLELAREVVDGLGNRFSPDICSLLLEELERNSDLPSEVWLETLADTPNGAWLQTQLLSRPRPRAAAWERFNSFQPLRDPLDLLAWARALAAAEEPEEAVRKLRTALSQEPGQQFFARAEKLVDELAGSVKSNLRQSKIAVMGTSTTNLLVPIIRALCLRDHIEAQIYEAPYGSVDQEIHDPSSGLARFQPNIILIVMHWRDLGLDAISGDEQTVIDRHIAQRKAIWKQMFELFQCHIVQPSFDYPATESYGHLSGILPGGRSRLIDLLNIRLREAAPSNVSILNLAAAQREVGMKRWEDESAWTRYRQHPSMEALPELAEAYLSHVRAVLGLTRKVLVTDLDNTLWHGVIGEDGVEGIGVGPGSAEGEAYLNLQRYMADLKNRGILLAVCSKNNLEDAQLPFRSHAHMALKLEDFAAFRANWEDKATNLRAIARDLSLGLDSFVFLDDNPLEREWVRSQIPEIAVVELGSSPFQFVRRLDRGRYFEAVSLSTEDLARAQRYRVEAQREDLRASSVSFEDFLMNLQLEASVEPITDKNLTRVTQLCNKTNQFNVTARRYTEAQVRAIAADPGSWAGAFHMSDRMGGYGLIGVVFARLEERSDDVWEVETWLMSCRTLGRQMEKFMFDRLVEAAIELGIRRIKGVYMPTKKNSLVKELFDQMGFRRVSESGKEVRYEFDVPEALTVTATHVRNTSAAAAKVGA